MLSTDIDDTQLQQALVALKDVEDDVISPEFRKAGEGTVKSLSNNLKGGVARVSGELRQSIVGEVKSVVGAEVDMQMSSLATHGGYNYGARLDKDGSMRWRSGKFKSWRTFGWFSYFLKTKARPVVRRNYVKAVENVVKTLIARMK